LGLKVFSERFLLKDSILKDLFLKDSILKDSGFVEKSDSERFHSERFRAPLSVDIGGQAVHEKKEPQESVQSNLIGSIGVIGRKDILFKPFLSKSSKKS
jgi:hypothetical protein